MKNEVIHLWIGSSPADRDSGAENVLEHSVRKHTKRDVWFHWMRAGDPGWKVANGIHGDAWNIGRDPAKPFVQTGPLSWFTNFTDFRYAIPEASGFEGRAIYLDVDMFANADIAEMWDHPMPKPWVTTKCSHKFRVEGSLIDCAYFKDKAWWPRIAEMKKGRNRKSYIKTLWEHDAVAKVMPAAFNTMDRYDPNAKIFHLTNTNTQVYRPYPDHRNYKTHPDPKLASLWFSLYEEVTGERHRHDIRSHAPV